MTLSMIAAGVAIAGFVLLAVFQFALALGMPWGHLAWGGWHKRLPKYLRVGSAFAVGIFVFGTVCMLEYLGVAHLLGWTQGLQRVALVLAVMLGLSTLANAISPSRPERLVMTPLALVLALSCAIVAMNPPTYP